MPKTKNPGHLMKLFSGSIFSAFLSDLGRQTEKGLTEEQCKANKLWLEEIADIAVNIPDGNIMGRKVFQRCQDIIKVYEAWNFPENTPKKRDKYKRKLRKKVSKLKAAYRKRTSILAEELDIEVYRAFYKSTAKLVESMPDLLVEIAKNVSKYSTTGTQET